MEQPITRLAQAQSTKDKIMIIASLLFAQNGYASVSMSHIAKQAKIRPAAIYYHFESKEALYDAILENIESVYEVFFRRTDEKIAKVETFEQVLDCLFGEVIDVYDMYIYFGYCSIITEQFRYEKATSAFTDVMVKRGIEYSVTKFDECVEKKWVKPFDTRAVATLFHNSVVVGTMMRTHEAMNHQTAYDTREMFISLKQLILDFVSSRA